ncbi:MAG: 4Fe-4S dicluster domain-containing protein, partial [Gammaproteobacteria bacterium]|nr:4Fe-4S dicluster domain-containing protein [Gammaproteobacteria bacterium]
MKYWKSIDELKNQAVEGDYSTSSEVSLLNDDGIRTDPSRRDFLKVLGFSLGYATLVTGCEMTVNKAIPYLNKPEEITPGKANYYASTYFDGSEYCSILVKTREGRPIKIEGNKLSNLTKGGTSARVQASLLSLYDSERLQFPLKHGSKSSWEEVDIEITQKLQEITDNKGTIVILTSSTISPSTKALLSDFTGHFPTTKIVNYDPVSYSSILQANEISFHEKVIPSYQFDKASVIVSFNADFLGTWLSPVEFTKQYIKNRKLNDDKRDMSTHVHYESALSLTGGNADKRVQIKPSEELSVLISIYNYIADRTSMLAPISGPDSPFEITEICKQLLSARGASLVISGSNNLDIQLTVNAINYLLDNYGNTIDLNTPIHIKQSDDQELLDLITELNNEKISGIILHNINPVYDFPDSEQIIAGLNKVDLSVAISQTLNETASLAHYVCPDSHYLESWNDAEPKKGFYSLSQPAIQKIFDTRQFQENLIKWTGKEESYYDYIINYWRDKVHSKFSKGSDFVQFWNKSLQDGIFEVLNTTDKAQPGFEIKSINRISTKRTNNGGDFEIILYEKISMGNGLHANNPWLQELPDPISKICWDNYVCIAPSDAKTHGIEEGDIVEINNSMEAPALIQAGQAQGTLALALGYGRNKAGKAGNGVGVNAYPLLQLSNNIEKWNFVSIGRTGRRHKFAQTQTHHTMEGREIVKESTLQEYNARHADRHADHGKNIYKDHEYNFHHWAMAIDLNACTGCGNCVIACQAENNIPVVGKEEVSRVHEMHWIRIDRYYSDDENDPKVVFQPMMCQHCDIAPCENVCPVLATTHSSEGLNQMTY